MQDAECQQNILFKVSASESQNNPGNSDDSAPGITAGHVLGLLLTLPERCAIMLQEWKFQGNTGNLVLIAYITLLEYEYGNFGKCQWVLL